VLQALKALVKEKPAADLQAALPSWAYLFARLSADNNRSVRSEACHVTAALAAAVGRGIAPLLKSLLPSLWLAQFDGYSETAAAARAALAVAFPSAAKQRDAVLFCRTEVWPLVLPLGIPLQCRCRAAVLAATLPVKHRMTALHVGLPAPHVCVKHCMAMGGRARMSNRSLRMGSDWDPHCGCCCRGRGRQAGRQAGGGNPAVRLHACLWWQRLRWAPTPLKKINLN
jgi:hypothetical protein